MKFFNREKKKVLDDNVHALAETPTPTERKIINERAKEHFQKKQAFEKDRVGFYKTLSKIGFAVGSQANGAQIISDNFFSIRIVS